MPHGGEGLVLLDCVHIGPEAAQRQVEQIDGFRCTYGGSRYCFQVVWVGGN